MSEFRKLPGSEALNQDRGVFNQFLEYLQTFVTPYIESNAFFVGIEVEKGPAALKFLRFAGRFIGASRPVSGTGFFDFYDFGTEISE